MMKKIETCANRRVRHWCSSINNVRFSNVTEHVEYCEKCKKYEPKEKKDIM